MKWKSNLRKNLTKPKSDSLKWKNEKKKMTKATSIRNEKEVITTDTMDIKG